MKRPLLTLFRQPAFQKDETAPASLAEGVLVALGVALRSASVDGLGLGLSWLGPAREHRPFLHLKRHVDRPLASGPYGRPS